MMPIRILRYLDELSISTVRKLLIMLDIFSLSPSIFTVLMAPITTVVTPSRLSTLSIHARWAALAQAENLNVASTNTIRVIY